MQFRSPANIRKFFIYIGHFKIKLFSEMMQFSDTILLIILLAFVYVAVMLLTSFRQTFNSPVIIPSLSCIYFYLDNCICFYLLLLLVWPRDDQSFHKLFISRLTYIQEMMIWKHPYLSYHIKIEYMELNTEPYSCNYDFHSFLIISNSEILF